MYYYGSLSLFLLSECTVIGSAIGELQVGMSAFGINGTQFIIVQRRGGNKIK